MNTSSWQSSWSPSTIWQQLCSGTFQFCFTHLNTQHFDYCHTWLFEKPVQAAEMWTGLLVNTDTTLQGEKRFPPSFHPTCSTCQDAHPSHPMPNPLFFKSHFKGCCFLARSQHYTRFEVPGPHLHHQWGGYKWSLRRENPFNGNFASRASALSPFPCHTLLNTCRKLPASLGSSSPVPDTNAEQAFKKLLVHPGCVSHLPALVSGAAGGVGQQT